MVHMTASSSALCTKVYSGPAKSESQTCKAQTLQLLFTIVEVCLTLFQKCLRIFSDLRMFLSLTFGMRILGKHIIITSITNGTMIIYVTVILINSLKSS